MCNMFHNILFADHCYFLFQDDSTIFYICISSLIVYHAADIYLLAWAHETFVTVQT